MTMPSIIGRPLIHRPLTRRGVLIGLGSAGSAWLSGCNSAEPQEAGGDQAAGATRSIETAHGSVAVPIAPARVVCTDFYSTYALFDVGFSPVGTAESTVGGVLATQQSAYDQLPKVGKTTELNYEAIAALRPDLILGTQAPGLAQDIYTRLSAMAPAALFAAGSPGDWKQRAVKAADAVGRGAPGEALATAYDNRIAEMKKTYATPLAELTWALFRATTAGTAFIDGPTS